MAKTRLNDFSTTAASNTDINSVAMTGASPISNIDGAIQNLAKMIADWIAGTYPINDTAAVNDPTDTTKKARIDAGSVPTGTTRALSAESLYELIRDGYGRAQVFTGTLSQVTESAGVPTGYLTAVDTVGSQRIMKHADGTLIITDAIMLTQASSSRLSATMTFEENFANLLYRVQATFRPPTNSDFGYTFISDCDLGATEIGPVVAGSYALGSCVLSAFSSVGASGGFGGNDKLYVDVTVIGRWY
jgi:hypothetical protein